MPYFQNVFTSDFHGSMVGDDRQYNINYKCPGNCGREDRAVMAFTYGPYDLSGNDAEGNGCEDLYIDFAMGPEYTQWTTLAIDITTEAASSSAVTVDEVVASLNADDNFAGWFTATVGGANAERYVRIALKASRDMKFYIVNGRAEEKLMFNLKSGIAELPTYYDRHVIGGNDTNALILLDTSNDVDSDVIDRAVDIKGKSQGHDSGVVQADYALLKGTSTAFMFTKNTVDGSNRITQSITYPAGAVVGDLAKKTVYSYTSSNTNPDKKVEIPYILSGSDLVTP